MTADQKTMLLWVFWDTEIFKLKLKKYVYYFIQACRTNFMKSLSKSQPSTNNSGKSIHILNLLTSFKKYLHTLSCIMQTLRKALLNNFSKYLTDNNNTTILITLVVFPSFRATRTNLSLTLALEVCQIPTTSIFALLISISRCS